MPPAVQVDLEGREPEPVSRRLWRRGRWQAFQVTPAEIVALRRELGVSQPVLVLTPEDERGRAKPVFDVIPGQRKKLVIPKRAVHGSSMLVTRRNAGAEEIWPEVETFLESFLR